MLGTLAASATAIFLCPSVPPWIHLDVLTYVFPLLKPCHCCGFCILSAWTVIPGEREDTRGASRTYVEVLLGHNQTYVLELEWKSAETRSRKKDQNLKLNQSFVPLANLILLPLLV